MSQLDCPACGASLDASSAADECPFCGESLQHLPTAARDLSAGRPAHHAVTSQRGFFPVEELPTSRHIEVVQDDADRAVLEISGGGSRSTSLLVFAVVWNAIVWPVFLVFAFAASDLPAFVALIPGLMVAIGTGLLYFAVRMRFARTLILLEPERIALQTILFGWKTTKQFALNSNSRASLQVAYEQNGEPVYRVDVCGADGSAKLATALSYEEKQWLAQSINRFLHADETSEMAAATDPRATKGKVIGETAPPLDPAAYVHNGTIQVDEYSDQLLHLSWAPLPPGRLRLVFTAVAVFFLGFSAVATALFTGPQLVRSLTDEDWFSVAFHAPFVLAFLMPSLFGLAIFCGRVHVRLNESHVEIGGGVLFLQYRYRRPLTDVTSVLIADPESSTMLKVTSRTGSSQTMKLIPPGCVLKLAGVPYPIPLTAGHSQQIATDVGGMIRWHLDHCNIVLSDQTVFDTTDRQT